MQHFGKIAGVLCLTAVLGACASQTTIKSSGAQTRLYLEDHANMMLPAHLEVSDTTFGNYSFKAVEEGHAPMYGMLPLDFQGGNLALDILFFTPATMFNLRGVFEYYQVDIEHGVIRYRNSTDDPWTVYHPKPDEVASARKLFGASSVARTNADDNVEPAETAGSRDTSHSGASPQASPR